MSSKLLESSKDETQYERWKREGKPPWWHVWGTKKPPVSRQIRERFTPVILLYVIAAFGIVYGYIKLLDRTATVPGQFEANPILLTPVSYTYQQQAVRILESPTSTTATPTVQHCIIYAPTVDVVPTLQQANPQCLILPP